MPPFPVSAYGEAVGKLITAQVQQIGLNSIFGPTPSERLIEASSATNPFTQTAQAVLGGAMGIMTGMDSQVALIRSSVVPL